MFDFPLIAFACIQVSGIVTEMLGLHLQTLCEENDQFSRGSLGSALVLEEGYHYYDQLSANFLHARRAPICSVSVRYPLN